MCFYNLDSNYLKVIVNLLFILSSALDEAAAALTRMRSEPSAGDGRSLVAACSQVIEIDGLCLNFRLID